MSAKMDSGPNRYRLGNVERPSIGGREVRLVDSVNDPILRQASARDCSDGRQHINEMYDVV